MKDSETKKKKDWKRISAESSFMFPVDPIGNGIELN